MLVYTVVDKSQPLSIIMLYTCPSTRRISVHLLYIVGRDDKTVSSTTFLASNYFLEFLEIIMREDDETRLWLLLVGFVRTFKRPLRGALTVLLKVILFFLSLTLQLSACFSTASQSLCKYTECIPFSSPSASWSGGLKFYLAIANGPR